MVCAPIGENCRHRRRRLNGTRLRTCARFEKQLCYTRVIVFGIPEHGTVTAPAQWRGVVVSVPYRDEITRVATTQ